MTKHNPETVVRIIKNWKSPDLMRQTPRMSGMWNDIRFTLDPVSEPDYVVVLNFVPEPTTITCTLENIWALMQEPFLPNVFGWLIHGHDQFARVISPHVFQTDNKYLKSQTCLPWHVNRSYDELISIAVPVKEKTLSAVASSKDIFPGHKTRLTFMRRLIEDMRIPLDAFGQGINPIDDKWEALAPYKYSLAIENSSTDDYWTEKLADCYLSYTLPIYYGCRNLEKYFPPKSFIQIDINDYESSVRTIQSLLEQDPWESRLEYIREARDLVLNKYQVFPFIANQIKQHQRRSTDRKVMRLLPWNENQALIDRKIPQISVIVCTYNREEMLPACLQSLAEQTLDKTLFEVIIVINNSNDNSKHIAQEFVTRYDNFRYIEEPKQGLSHARNTGYHTARSAYVAFTDDDARVPADWLETAVKIVLEKGPDIFGGPVYPLIDGKAPHWFKTSYAVRGDMGDTRWLENGFIVGTNIFFKKTLLQEYGGFDPDLGMKGDAIGYHEETVLVYRAFRDKKKVYYAKELAVNDVMPDYKLSLAYHICSRYTSGREKAKLNHREFSCEDFAALADLLDATLREFDVALRKRDVNKYPYPENYIIEKLRPNIVAIGEMVGTYLQSKNTA